MSRPVADRPRIAFYAPMKSPDHPNPSGDRKIARLTLQALRIAGFDPYVVSDLRTLDIHGDLATQRVMIEEAEAEQTRLHDAFQDAPPALWFTYHCHYKAPDLLGPVLSEAFGIPYAISEPSISPKRRKGPWSDFTKRSDAAIARADRMFWTTARDRTVLAREGHTDRMTHLPAFVKTLQMPDRQASPHDPLRLLTVAMMRAGDKLESYRRLAAAMQCMQSNWHLTIIGDGAARTEVEAMFGSFGGRVTFKGQIDCAEQLSDAFRQADIFLWPGVGEGVGMVYLEAQAAGLPVVAEDHPAPAELVTGTCVPAGAPHSFANRILQIADKATYRKESTAAYTHVLSRHSLEAAATTLRDTLGPLLK